ncbi:ABC-2 type transport system ATP-binding protein [Acetitomaculum ruminis DSM 5522]|uniref:ABC-2 type transport system ATP-binding protein n=1 Tax=Acetitomaculum ruminis DSM 5522 TaxID=1120918 RepID=A0A1I1A3A6_9FIRM|nr:ATP-binding cassette domain-containing protein [Acetitomaculum ruminis]SFB32479.1 ABC-2 type transport system ATP-binding protein [Acetitomaculum ruminis DSM 5522]
MVINIKDYTKVIKNETILDNINLNFESGKIYGIKGKNGSGKTMLLRAVCGLINPSKGCVLIDKEVLGKDISFPKSVGALIENPGFIPNYTGKKNLCILGKIKGKVTEVDIDDILLKVGLKDAANKKFKEYSLGMKQKLGIAAALFEDPDLIILDEPTNALDEASIKGLRNILEEYKKRDKLIILTCHDSDELNFLSDEIIKIENGRVKL